MLHFETVSWLIPVTERYSMALGIIKEEEQEN